MAESACSSSSSIGADLVLRGGVIITLDPARPTTEALAVRGDRITALGGSDEIEKYISSATTMIDLAGRLVVPGFIEGHAHFMGLGESLMQLDLAAVRNFDEIAELVFQEAAGLQPGQWIQGHGWHQEKWERTPEPSVDGIPCNPRLNEAAPHNPVFLVHASGHMGLANAAAIETAGVDSADGIFREEAMQAIFGAIQASRRSLNKQESDAHHQRAAKLALRECLSKGITSFQDAGSSFEEIEFFKRLAEKDLLGLRLWVMISEDNPALEENLELYRIVSGGNKHLSVRAIKRHADGALGTHGAWLIEPYADLPASRGMNTTPLEEIARTARLAHEHGFQLCTHAIGDRACREVLDVYEKIFSQNPQANDLRWRIEHAQHLSALDVPRFARLGVTASMQGVHCVSDAPWVRKRLGEPRAREGAYAWRSLLDSGALLTNGSDAPVENVDPVAGFHALVTRRTRDGNVFFPQQRLTRSEALRACTLSAARAAFEENDKGSLEPGKLADMVILSHDIMSVPEDQILQTRIMLTILGGRVVYRAGSEYGNTLGRNHR
ncbi:MAG TPA: amidohydrolase [Myxococcota bacterium]|nr:amidohydrolase [Myxococcota bacterium]